MCARAKRTLVGSQFYMSAEFDPTKTRVTTDALADFLRAPISGIITEVPGVGVRTSAILAKHGIETTHQLIGKFLMFCAKDDTTRTHCNKFLEWLISIESPPTYRTTITHVIAEKLSVLFPGIYDGSEFVD